MSSASLKRFLFYIIAFLVVMNAFYWSGFLWEATDEMIVSELSYDTAKASEVRGSIAVVDVNILQDNPSDSEGCIACQRNILVNLLKTINAEKQKPEVLILDFAFSNDTTQIKALSKEIKILQKDVKVYASYDIDAYLAAPEDQKEFFNFDLLQAQELYDLLGKRLHTNYTLKYKPKDKRFLIEHETVKYLNNLNIDGSIDSVAIESVIKRVHLDQTDADAKVGYSTNLVPMGNQESMERKTYRFNPGKENELGKFDPHPKNTEATLNFKKKDFIIVGDLTNDHINTPERSDIYFPGPYLVAWTLSEELANENQKIIKQYEASFIINIIQVIVFSLFTVLIFGLLFKYIKSLQTKPWALALLSVIITFGVLALYVVLFLSQDKIPLIGLTCIGIVVTALLSWRYALKFLVLGIIEGGGVYDVFISYSHNDYDWVKKNLYLPLAEFKKEDGKKLKIFFDENSIGLGEFFTRKYMRGIADSQVIIPVISKSYNVKNHCQNELNIAVTRKVEKLMEMFIVTFDFKIVPPELNTILLLDVSQKENFIEELKAELNKKLKSNTAN